MIETLVSKSAGVHNHHQLTPPAARLPQQGSAELVQPPPVEGFTDISAEQRKVDMLSSFVLGVPRLESRAGTDSPRRDKV